jgi:hypothetical protein
VTIQRLSGVGFLLNSKVSEKKKSH